MIRDRFGQRLATTSQPAADAYVAALDALLAADPDVLEQSEAALQLDPGFGLAHSLHARALAQHGRTRDSIAAAERGRRLAAGASARERVHAEIVALATEGASAAALALLREHLREHPRDALPLSLALGVYGLLAFSGIVDHHARQRDLLAALAPHFKADWWFDASLGWAYVEAGEPAHGIDLLERSLATRPRNANAAHGRVHGHYEQGEPAAGDAFLANWLPGYDRRGVLHCHLCWHRAIFALQLGEPARALRLYQESIRPAVSLTLPMFTMIDGASLAWRTALHGHPLARAELEALVAFLGERWQRADIPFANTHAALILATAGETAALDALITELGAAAANRPQQPAWATATGLCEAIAAFGAGDHRGATQRLAPWLDQAPRLGGSHAQRDLFIDTHIAALLRHGADDAALHARRQRSAHRAPHLDEAWLARLRP